MIFVPARAFEGLEEYEAGGDFLSGLQSYDPCLFAYRDYREGGKIVVFSKRQGAKVYEFSAKRQYAENWGELERRILSNLGKIDIWKRHGSGEKFDDALADEAEDAKKKKLADAKSERIDRVKEDVDRARHDLKINPRVNVPINL